MTPSTTSDDRPARTRQSEGQEQNTKAPVVESESLFRGGSEIIIRHHGADYRMKITRQGKLILNK